MPDLRVLDQIWTSSASPAPIGLRCHSRTPAATRQQARSSRHPLTHVGTPILHYGTNATAARRPPPRWDQGTTEVTDWDQGTTASPKLAQAGFTAARVDSTTWESAAAPASLLHRPPCAARAAANPPTHYRPRAASTVHRRPTAPPAARRRRPRTATTTGACPKRCLPN